MPLSTGDKLDQDKSLRPSARSVLVTSPLTRRYSVRQTESVCMLTLLARFLGAILFVELLAAAAPPSMSAAVHGELSKVATTTQNLDHIRRLELNNPGGAADAWQEARADEGLRQVFERAMYSLEESGNGTYRGVN